MVTVMKSRASDVKVFFSERVDFALYATRAVEQRFSHCISMNPASPLACIAYKYLDALLLKENDATPKRFAYGPICLP
jgi:hypothetical protein